MKIIRYLNPALIIKDYFDCSNITAYCAFIVMSISCYGTFRVGLKNSESRQLAQEWRYKNGYTMRVYDGSYEGYVYCQPGDLNNCVTISNNRFR